MIRVVYHPRYFQLRVQGHARSGEPGRDLVCAAASVLAVTLADNLTALEKGGQVRGMDLSLQPGKAELRCTPRAGYRAVVRLVLDTVAVGYERLAREYPEYVVYEVHR